MSRFEKNSKFIEHFMDVARETPEGILGWYEGIPVYIVTKEVQRRKHHKKRINKKWKKRYGVVEINMMPDGQVVFNEFDRALYMTKKTFEEIKKLAEGGEQE